LVVEHSLFQSNTAVYGGGIATRPYHNLKVDHTDILSNAAMFAGGGVHIGHGFLFDDLSGADRNAETAGLVTTSNLIVHASKINNNNAGITGENGGLGEGGGIYMEFVNVSEIDSSTIDDNKASSSGGGIYMERSSSSIGYSSISGNRAYGLGGGIYGRGEPNCFNQLSIDHSTMANDTASYSGGAIATTTLCTDISFSTISENRVLLGGNAGAINFSAFSGEDVPLNISNSTIVNNNASSDEITDPSLTRGFAPGNGGGGIRMHNGNTLNLKSSIVAQNTADFWGQDILNAARSSTVNTDSFNLVGDTCYSTFMRILGFDLVGGCMDNALDPGIGPLEDNGGITLTHALECSSPAFNAGSGDVDTTDQVGQTVFGPNQDIGAFEAQDDAVDHDGDGWCRVDRDCVEFEDELPPGAMDAELGPGDFNPGAEELCDGFDNNCDGLVDNGEDCDPYCEAWGDNDPYYISRVRYGFPTANARDNQTGPEPGGYGNYPNPPGVILNANAFRVNFILTPGGPNALRYWTVFVDWNNDGDFDDFSERNNLRRSTHQINKSISIPGFRRGVACSYKVRVRMSTNGYTEPCGFFTGGEVEDYVLCIKECVSCGEQEVPFVINPDNPRERLRYAESSQLELFPNPVRDMLNFEFESTIDQEVQLRIMSAHGVNKHNADTYFHAGWNQMEIPIEDLAAGLYYLVIESPEGIMMKAFHKL
jgi:hypothetical protein